MKIKKSVEMPDGMFEIDGEFSAEEINVILEVGLNTLYQQGALPFSLVDKKEIAKMAPYVPSEPQ